MSIVHRVLFIRHGETQANISSYFSGQSNSPLTELGLEQARHAADAIVAFGPDRIFASPLDRAQIIARTASEQLGIESVTLELIGEMDFGEMEGKHLSHLSEYGITWPWPRNAQGLSTPCPGGETFEHAYGRAGLILEQVRAGRGRTACVTHGGIMRCILGKHLNIPYEDVWNIRLVNVSSMLFTCTDTGRIMLEGLGYTPEEVIFRCTNESLYDPFEAFGGRGDES